MQTTTITIIILLIILIIVAVKIHILLYQQLPMNLRIVKGYLIIQLHRQFNSMTRMATTTCNGSSHIIAVI